MRIKTGGVTLTLGLAYLTVLAHERNRNTQAQALRAQSRVLNSLLEPEAVPPPRSRAEMAREERSTIVETAKDRWNEEVENAVRWVQRSDWNGVREGMEGAVSRLLGSGFRKSRNGIDEAEKLGGPKVRETVDNTGAAARKGMDQVAVEIDKAATYSIAQVEKVGAGVKDKASRIIESTKSSARNVAEQRDAAEEKAEKLLATASSGAHDAAEPTRVSGDSGTVDAARGTLRDFINQGIEKGREAIGKAHVAIGLAEEKMESTAQSSTLSDSSAVEKSLRERYEQSKVLEKPVKDALAERYEPIDARDNTVLRGL